MKLFWVKHYNSYYQTDYGINRFQSSICKHYYLSVCLKKYFNYGAMFSFSRLLDCGLLLWLEAGAISWQLYILVRGCGNFNSCQPESHIFAQLPLRNNTLFLFSECMCCSIYYVVLTRYWITWNRICLCSHASCALREVWRPNWWFPLQPPRSAARSVSEARPRCLEQDTQREHEG